VEGVADLPNWLTGCSYLIGIHLVPRSCLETHGHAIPATSAPLYPTGFFPVLVVVVLRGGIATVPPGGVVVPVGGVTVTEPIWIVLPGVTNVFALDIHLIGTSKLSRSPDVPAAFMLFVSIL